MTFKQDLRMTHVPSSGGSDSLSDLDINLALRNNGASGDELKVILWRLAL